MDDCCKPVPKVEYGWMEAGGESAHGPFDSQRAAIEAAEEYLDPDYEHEIYVGVVRRFDPAKYIGVDWIVEAVEEAAGDEDFAWCDDSICDVAKEDEEQAATELVAWMRKWVKSDYWFLDTEGESPMTVPRPPECKTCEGDEYLQPCDDCGGSK
jgi:hypothetical protein